MSNEIEELLQAYKYKNNPLEESVVKLCLHYGIVIEDSIISQITDLLVDYKFNVSSKLKNTLEGLDLLLNTKSSKQFSSVQKVKPIFKTDQVVNDLKNLGILNKQLS